MTGWQDSFQPVASNPATQGGWQSSFQPEAPDMMEDIGKSAASGLAKGASYAMNPTGMLRSISAPVAEGITRLAGSAYEGMGGELSPSMAHYLTYPMGEPGSSATDLLQSKVLPAAVQSATGMDMNYAPQTTGGNIAQKSTEMLPYLMGGEGSALTTGTRALGSGTLSEGSQKIAQALGFGDKGQQVASTLGMIAGTGAPEAIDYAKQSLTTPPKVTAGDVRDMATQSFKKANDLGGILKPQITDSWIDKASQLLPQTEEGKTVLGDTPTTRLVENIQALRGKPLTLQGALEIDSALGDKMSSEIHPQTGKLNAEGNKISQIQQALRDTWESAGENDVMGGKAGFDAAKQGRDLWAASARMNDIERIINRAQQSDNPVTALKTGFRTIVNNPVRMRGFNPAETAAIKKAAETGVVTGTLRTMGSRLVSPIVGGLVGGAPGAAIGYGVAEGSKAIANARQLKRANNVTQQIASRAPIKAITAPPMPSSMPTTYPYAALLAPMEDNQQLPSPFSLLALPSPDRYRQ